MTLKQAVGLVPSLNPVIFRFRIWDSDEYPKRRGPLLSKVSKKCIGKLLNRSMRGWLEAEETLPSDDKNSTLTLM